MKKKKEDFICYVCGTAGHTARRCRDRKGKGPAPKQRKEAHVVLGPSSSEGYVPQAFMASPSNDWWIDSGATIHICADRSAFSSFQGAASGPVLMGNGVPAAIRGIGQVCLKMTSGKTIILKDVLFVPTINRNLISVSQLLRQGLKLVFESNKVILTKFGNFIGKAYESDGLFHMSVMNNYSFSAIHQSCNKNNDMWHSRLCHINSRAIKHLSNMNLIPEYKLDTSRCEICVQAKQPRLPFKTVEEKGNSPLDLVHSDVCEMNGIISKGGKRYFLTLIDDATRYCYIFLMRTKDEALEHFKIYKAEVENQLDRKIKRLRSDRGGEYLSNLFSKYCAESGIIHETTAPYSPQSNGVAERKNRTVCDLVNSLLQSSGMSDV
jgi:hypothetical protein